MDNKDKVILRRILDHAEAIVAETATIKDARAFRDNNDQTKAALFDLLQIGELAKDGLSQETVKTMDAIPWKEIYALRNRIVHGYASVDYQIIWETITDDIPKLIKALREAIKKD